MKHHSLRVHFTWKTPPLLKLWEHDQTVTPRPASGDLRSLVILAQYLPQFCNLLRFEYLLAPAQVVHAFCDREGAQFFTHQQKDPRKFSSRPTTLLELRETRLTKMDTKVQHLLLDPFKIVVHPSQKIVILGCESRLVDSLKTAMIPSVVFPNVMNFELYEAASVLKQIADTAALAGHYQDALQRYHFIAFVLPHDFFKNLPQELLYTNDWWRISESRLSILIAECAVSWLWLLLKCGEPFPDQTEANKTIAMCMRAPDSVHIGCEHTHITSLWTLVRPADDDDDSGVADYLSTNWPTASFALES